MELRILRLVLTSIRKPRRGDVQKVKHDFYSEDAELVLQTRIPQNQVSDRLAWTHSSNVMYTVKTGYHFWFSRNHIMLKDSDSKGWRRLWSIKLPHKVKVILWLFCKNTLPVRNLIRSRGITFPICRCFLIATFLNNAGLKWGMSLI